MTQTEERQMLLEAAKRSINNFETSATKTGRYKGERRLCNVLMQLDARNETDPLSLDSSAHKLLKARDALCDEMVGQAMGNETSIARAENYATELLSSIPEITYGPGAPIQYDVENLLLVIKRNLPHARQQATRQDQPQTAWADKVAKTSEPEPTYEEVIAAAKETVMQYELNGSPISKILDGLAKNPNESNHSLAIKAIGTLCHQVALEAYGLKGALSAAITPTSNNSLDMLATHLKHHTMHDVELRGQNPLASLPLAMLNKVQPLADRARSTAGPAPQLLA